VVLPPHFVDRECKLLRYLQAARFDYEKTYQAITNYLEWETQLPPLDVMSQRVIQTIQSGAIYVFGRDRSYRPTIVYNINAMKTLLANEEA
jgi:hypothetical protein